MKKVILASVVAAAALSTISVANAAETTGAACAAPSAAGNGSFTTVASGFVKAAFTPKCSANVHLAYGQDATYLRAGAVSTKGGRSFMGSTAGGSVVSSATCTSCVSTDATAAATSASNPTSG